MTGEPEEPDGPDAAALARATTVLHALATPVRLGVVAVLAAGPRYVHELAEDLDVRESLVSQHLRVLRAAGLVRCEREGFRSRYSLVDERWAGRVLELVGLGAGASGTSALSR